MKKEFKKFLAYSSLIATSVFTISSIGFSSSFLNSFSHSQKNSDLKKIKNSLNSNSNSNLVLKGVNLHNNNTPSKKEAIIKNYGFSSSSSSSTTSFQPSFSDPRQLYAFNAEDHSFVVINSSSSSSFDNITMFSANGTILWSRPTSDFGSGKKFLSVAFLPKNNIDRTDDLLLVLVEGSTNNQVFLSTLIWNTGINFSSNKQLNNLESHSKVFENIHSTTTSGSGTSNTHDNVTYINIVNSINLEIYIISLDLHNEKDSSLNYLKITDLNSFSSVSSKKVKINESVYKSFFVNEKAKTTSIFSDNSNFYFVIQNYDSSFSSSTDDSNLVSVLSLPNNLDTFSNFSASNFISFGITKEQAKNLTDKNNLIVSSTTFNNKTHILVTQNPTTTTSDTNTTQNKIYLHAEFDNTKFGSTTNLKFNEINSADPNGFIVQLFPLYSNTNNALGYVGLSTSNKAIFFDSEFKNSQILFDFDNLNAKSSKKKIYNIFTRRNDTSWYGIMEDGVVLQFSNSFLIGELTKVQGTEREEILATFDFVNLNQVDKSILFYDTSSPIFLEFLEQNINKILNIRSYDPLFGKPKIKVKNLKNSNNEIVLGFEQVLRKRTSDSIVDSGKTVFLGTQAYNFVSDVASYRIKDKSETPTNLLNKLPREIKVSDLEDFIELKNYGNVNVVLIPDDAAGSLKVSLISDYARVNENNQKVLKRNYNQTIEVGTKENPYFKVDQLSGLDSNILLIDKQHYEKQKDDLKFLELKYSSTLPSEVSKQEILTDFIKLGNAYNNQLVSSDLLTAPTANDVTLVPVDGEGFIYVTIRVPKILDKTNIIYSFVTPSIFKKDIFSHQNTFLQFKQNSDVLNITPPTTNNQKLLSLLPSKIKEGLDNEITKKTWVEYFLEMSYFVSSLIFDEKKVKLEIIPNDSLGALTFKIIFPDTIDGLNEKELTHVFTGFATTTQNNIKTSTFSFNRDFNVNTIEGFASKKASEVTLEDVETKFGALFSYGVGASSSSLLKKKISITPIDSFGALKVSITFDNWIEDESQGENNTIKKIVPKRTFSTVITGFKQFQNFSDTLVWKSFDSLDPQLKSSTTTNTLNALNSFSSPLQKLEKLANISDTLKEKLRKDDSKLDLSFQVDESIGVMQVFASFILNGKLQTYNTTYSGFQINNSRYNILLADSKSEVVKKIKDTIPSQLTDVQINSLVEVPVGKGLTKKISVETDDINGIVKVTAQLVSENGSTENLPFDTKTYSGFKTNNPVYKGTNYWIVGLSILVPIILLILPILWIVLIKNKIDIRRYSKVLDRRLSQKLTKTKKTVNVETVEDLLLLEND